MLNEEAGPSLLSLSKKLALSTRATNVLCENFDSISGLLDYHSSGKSFLKLANSGVKTANEIEEVCKRILDETLFPGMAEESSELACISTSVCQLSKLAKELIRTQFAKLDYCGERKECEMSKSMFSLQDLLEHYKNHDFYKFSWFKQMTLAECLGCSGFWGVGRLDPLDKMLLVFHLSKGAVKAIRRSFRSTNHLLQFWKNGESFTSIPGIGSLKAKEIEGVCKLLSQFNSTKLIIPPNLKGPDAESNKIDFQNHIGMNNQPNSNSLIVSQFLEVFIDWFYVDSPVEVINRVLFVRTETAAFVKENASLLLLVFGLRKWKSRKEISKILNMASRCKLSLMSILINMLYMPLFSSVERQILFRKSLNLNGKNKPTLAQIGADLDICRERVRQLNEEAKGKFIKNIVALSFSYKLDKNLSFLKEGPLCLIGNMSEIESQLKSGFELEMSSGFIQFVLPRMLETDWHLIRSDERPGLVLFVSKQICQDGQTIHRLLECLKAKSAANNGCICAKSLEEFAKYIDGELLSELGDKFLGYIHIILEFGFFIEIDHSSEIIYLVSRAASLTDLLVALLEIRGKPMHHDEIISVFNKTFNILTTKEKIQSMVFRDNRLIALGKSGIYALISWAKTGKGLITGTVCDVAEQLLEHEKYPLHIDELAQMIGDQGRGSSRNHIYTMIRSDPRNRFRLVGRGYFALNRNKSDNSEGVK